MLTKKYLLHKLIFQKKADKITLNLISIKGRVSFLWVYCLDVFHPVGTPLYCDRSEYSAEKFGYVVEEVLLPLALDYHVRSRTNEVDAVVSAEVTNLNGDTSVFNAAVKVWRVRWWYFQHVTRKTTKLPCSQSRIKDHSIWEASEKSNFHNLSPFYFTYIMFSLSFFSSLVLFFLLA